MRLRPEPTRAATCAVYAPGGRVTSRSEEHTSELQSPCNLVCRLLLEKKKQNRLIFGRIQRQHKEDSVNLRRCQIWTTEINWRRGLCCWLQCTTQLSNQPCDDTHAAYS